MNPKRLIGFAAGLLAVGLITLIVRSHQPARQGATARKIAVVASIYPLYFFAERIGGDAADIYNITPAGAEPHDYEPTAQDLVRIEKSRLLIVNGGNLEAWVDRIRKNIDPHHPLVVTAGEGLTTQQVVEHGARLIDPHVWLSPPLAGRMVAAITRAFAQVDPAHAADYQSRGAALASDIDNLDTAYRRGLADCEDHTIITAHAAFGYLASAYHLDQLPIAGLSPDGEPSPKQLAEIAQFARRHHVQYIFFENLVSPKLAQTLATEVGAKTMILNPIEGLSAEEAAQGKTYLTEMKSNLANLRIALRCQS